MLPVTLASAAAKASSAPCDGSLPQSFSTIDGFCWPIDITAAFARCAMSRIEVPDFPDTRSTGFVSTGFVAGVAIAICTEAEAPVFFAGSTGREASAGGEAEASLTPSLALGATPSAEAAANRSLNITEGTASAVSFFGTEAAACGRSPNAVLIMAAGVLRTIELVAGCVSGTSALACIDGKTLAPRMLLYTVQPQPIKRPATAVVPANPENLA